MGVDWTIVDEIRLFRWVAEFKPAGMNKHFHMYCIVERMNHPDRYPVVLLQKESAKPVKSFTATEIWDKLSQYYDFERMDEIEDQVPSESSDYAIAKHKVHLAQYRNFELPWEEYGDLILDHAKGEEEVASPNEAQDDSPVSPAENEREDARRKRRSARLRKSARINPSSEGEGEGEVRAEVKGELEGEVKGEVKGEVEGDEIKSDEVKGDEVKGDEVKGDEVKGDEVSGDEVKGDEVQTGVNGEVRTESEGEPKDGGHEEGHEPSPSGSERDGESGTVMQSHQPMAKRTRHSSSISAGVANTSEPSPNKKKRKTDPLPPQPDSAPGSSPAAPTAASPEAAASPVAPAPAPAPAPSVRTSSRVSSRLRNRK